MNLIGKIFVVLILVMSLVFAAFSIAVYGTHQNWKKAAKDADEKRKAAMQQVAQAEEEKTNLTKQIEAEQLAKREALQKLETQRDELAKQRDEAAKQRDVLVAKDKETVAALDVAQQNLAKLTKEVDVLRTDIRTAEADRDKHFDKVVDLTDRIHQAQGELRRLDERNLQLASQVAAGKRVMDAHGLTKDTPVDNIPPAIRGKILAINRDNMVEVSLGEDDGLRPGHTLEVFRGSKYLGRVEVLHASPDRSVGKILPGFKKGVIQKDDDVATRFKVS